VLGAHFAAGRLNTGDYEQRVTAAYEAATLARARCSKTCPNRGLRSSARLTMPPMGSYRCE
jgi:hypothetical protein